MLQKKINELNEKWEIELMPNGISGVQQKFEPRLKDRLRCLIECCPEDAEFKVAKKIRVKLSGDGTKVGMFTNYSCSHDSYLNDNDFN